MKTQEYTLADLRNSRLLRSSDRSGKALIVTLEYAGGGQRQYRVWPGTLTSHAYPARTLDHWHALLENMERSRDQQLEFDRAFGGR